MERLMFFAQMSGIAKVILGSYKHYLYTPALVFEPLTIKECKEYDPQFSETSWNAASQFSRDDMTRIVKPGIRTNYLYLQHFLSLFLNFEF